jgi:3-oxoacyl-[acyl-carrier protein] reductase
MTTYSGLEGKVAVVTGGSRGIGAGTARLLGKQGAKVVVSGRDETAMAAVVDAIEQDGGTAIAIAAEATDLAALANLRDRAEAELGPVEVLMAFAGGNPSRPKPLMEMSEVEWRKAVDENLTATFLALRAFVPGMISRGSGAVITMSSSAGRLAGMVSPGAYSAAKAGVVMLSQKVATEVGPSGVRVNCVAPSAIRTERVGASMPPDIEKQVAQMHPLRRIGETGDVAEAAVFLASDSASWLTGITIDVAGGRITS